MFLSRKLSNLVCLEEDFQVYLAGLIGYCCCDICNLFGLVGG